MYYDNIIVIGSGSLLTNCLKLICKQPHLSVKCIQTEKADFSNLTSICLENGTRYLSLNGKTEITNYFLDVSERSLVLSIHNNYIFSKAVLENNNLKIINFHNSLLPKHPGRNAPSWAIYEEDEKAGITWHEVIHEIDKGDIIFQNSVDINMRMTGLELTRICVNIGFEGFIEIFPLLLKNDYPTKEQQWDGKIKMHYAYEIPNEGIVDTGWTASKLSAFLRSVDYGLYRVFARPAIFHNGRYYHVDGYELSEPSNEPVADQGANNKVLYFHDDRVSVKLKIKQLIN